MFLLVASTVWTCINLYPAVLIIPGSGLPTRSNERRGGGASATTNCPLKFDNMAL